MIFSIKYCFKQLTKKAHILNSLYQLKNYKLKINT
jgi:hypothetical protein